MADHKLKGTITAKFTVSTPKLKKDSRLKGSIPLTISVSHGRK